ncbi:MAG: DNA-processing protein DprA [Acidimicrobiia bacterium]
MSVLPPEAFAAALAGLPGVGPVQLGRLLAGHPPDEAWRRAIADRRPRPGLDHVAAAWSAVRSAGLGVSVAGHPGYPPALADDPEAPAVLFARGDVGVLEGRRVAIVGTRNCTRYGRDVAFELGRDLAANGVRVVSGLALGVDGAAHSGALAAGPGAAPPVAVVGSGLDVVYPRRHAALWRQVGEVGVLLSEAPLGAAPEAWRFPVRNRILAGLAEVVVVVESPHSGGSRYTVEAAMARDRPVLAVPGPVRSPTSDLPNALLSEGCHPVRDALDVLVALDLTPTVGTATPAADPRPPPDPAGAAVLEAIGWRPATFEQVVVATGRSPGEVGLALAHLERDRWVAGSAGWWERIGTE